MSISDSKRPDRIAFQDKNLLIVLFWLGFLIIFLGLFETPVKKVAADFNSERLTGGLAEKLVIIQENSLLAAINPVYIEQPKIIEAVVTAYSSTVEETDSDPFITASGAEVRDGIVANNMLSMGTKVRFPEIYPDRIFVVEDRMHWGKGSYQFDIWMDSKLKAKNFGVKITQAEIIK